MKFIALAAISCLTPFAATASGSLAQPEVKAFYADPMHCAYMVDTTADATDKVAAQFSKAVTSAVAALRRAQPSMTHDKALFYLREGCETTLKAAAK